MEYEVKVVSTTIVYVEAESEAEAIKTASAVCWKYEPDEINCEIIDVCGD